MNTHVVAALRCLLLFVFPAVTYAGSAQWNLNPTSGDWNTAENWTPATVPNGPADVATFALSNIGPSISEDTEVNGITFVNPNGVTVNPNSVLTISGTGVIGDGGFEVATNGFFDGGIIVFSNQSTAGDSDIHVSGGGGVEFTDNSTAGNANFRYGAGGVIFFLDSSTAGNAHFSALLDAALAFSGSATAGNAVIEISDFSSFVMFSGTSSAGNAMVGSSAYTSFSDSSTASNATIGVFGEYLVFSGSSEGGRAQIELTFDLTRLVPAILDISGHNSPGVTIGSLEGEESNLVFLGANNLTVGSNNLSTTFSGVIEDNGFSGSLTKIGKGTFNLKGANAYTGQTNVNGGVLQVDGSTSSNAFINNKGDLAGVGTVNGNVTNYGGTVSPGDPLGVPGVLTVSNNYMQTPSATLTVQIGGTDPGQISVLNVLGNANLNGSLDPELINGFVPDVGQSFTILGYASVTGSFSHIKNPVFDHGTKRWTLVYGPTGTSLVVVRNGQRLDGSRASYR